MANDQIWENIIQQTESELLLVGENPHTEIIAPDVSLGLNSHISSVMPQFMSAHDITVFIGVLAESHACDSQSISYYYEPIINEEGCLSLDELVLIFSIKSLINGEIINRVIHRIRTIIPQEVQQRARAMLEREQSETNILSGTNETQSVAPEKRATRKKMPRLPENNQTATLPRDSIPLDAIAKATPRATRVATRSKKNI